jgi:light-regulated signal transduction histidine kinase (bacteriophytochrome)
MAAEQSTTPTLSQLRHELRTSLNHVLGYSEMILESASVSDDVEIQLLLHDIRTEAQNILRLVETCLAVTDETAPSVRLEDLHGQVRDPLHRLIRLSAALAHRSGDEILEDSLRIGSAASKLLSVIALGQPPVSDARSEADENAVDVPVTMPGAHVLIVDDDEANRDILTRTLARQGYKTDSAETGEEALRMLRHGGYDLVLLDVMMPGMDGCAVLAEMRADASLRELPVVMISAFDEMSNVVACIQSGAIDYLFKPFNPVLMRARLAATLERKRLLDTERARTRELESLSNELKRSNEDLERFAYAVSHDLQAPLRTMVSFMQLIQRKLGGKLEEEPTRLISDAIAAGKRMSQLVKDLLDYSQLTTRTLETEQVAVDEVVREVLADLQPVLTDAGADVRTVALPTVTADRVQLRQVFQNLIGNGIKYHRDRPPVIEIGCQRQNGSWRFSVADNGMGIRPEDIPTIFQMFRRLHGPDLPGSGIGLATCQRIVERLGGRIDVESVPGEGSTFFFSIPDETGTGEVSDAR